MEVLLRFMMNVVVLGFAGLAILAALAIGFGDVKALRNVSVRAVLTLALAALGIWFLSTGIQHIVSG
jgi:hypothetical protein